MKIPSEVERVMDCQHRAQQNGRLSLWTVFDHPADYPDSFVARRFEVGPTGTEPSAVMTVATGDALEGATLHAIRICLYHAGLTCLARSPDDDANIVETWL